jgi:hypothetical protein
VTTRWDVQSFLRAEPRNARSIPVRQGARIELTTRPLGVAPGASAGSRVAVVDGVIPETGERLQWVVLLDNDLPGPSLWWRLVHGGG